MKILIAAGTDVNTKTGNENTILIETSYTGDAEIIELLVKAGADHDACNNDFHTPYVAAVLRGHTHVLDIIKQAFIERNQART